MRFASVSGIEVGAALGVYWEPTPTLKLGASYTSQPNFGSMRMSGTFQFYQPGQPAPPQTKADLIESYPDIIRAGAAWRIAPQAELRFDVSWQRWSQFANQCVVTSGASCNRDQNKLR